MWTLRLAATEPIHSPISNAARHAVRGPDHRLAPRTTSASSAAWLAASEIVHPSSARVAPIECSIDTADGRRGGRRASLSKVSIHAGHSGVNEPVCARRRRAPTGRAERASCRRTPRSRSTTPVVRCAIPRRSRTRRAGIIPAVRGHYAERSVPLARLGLRGEVPSTVAHGGCDDERRAVSMGAGPASTAESTSPHPTRPLRARLGEPDAGERRGPIGPSGAAFDQDQRIRLLSRASSLGERTRFGD